MQEVLEILKNKHESGFTPMQLRIWGEMIAGGLHSSTDDPPQTSMFSRAGGKAIQKKSSQVTNLITEAATAITSALTSPKPSGVVVQTTSPAKMISKLYRQLSELHNLHSTGVLTDSEYASEKQTIMDILQKLKAAH